MILQMKLPDALSFITRIKLHFYTSNLGPFFHFQMTLARPKAYLPNWAMATVLAGFVAGTYWYSMRAVGSDDLEKELARENARQQKKLQESA